MTTNLQNEETMVPSWPDVIMCGSNAFFLHDAGSNTGGVGGMYVQVYGLEQSVIVFGLSGAPYGVSWCEHWSL